MSVNKRFSVIEDGEGASTSSRTDRETDLMAAATRVFAEKGFHDTKVSDIVARAGVAQGTFYLYFKSKNDVFFRLVSSCCERVLNKVGAASEARAHVTNAAESRANSLRFLTGLFQLLEQERSVLRLILANPTGIDPAIDKMLISLKEALVERVRQNLEKGIAAGYLRPSNTTIVAEAVVGMVYHLAFEQFVRGRDLGVSLDEVVKEVVTFEHDGLLKKT